MEEDGPRRESIEVQQEKLRILLNLAELNRDQSSEAVAGARTKVLPSGEKRYRRGIGDVQ